MIQADKLLNRNAAPAVVKLTRAEARRIKNRSAADKLMDSARKTLVRQYIIKQNKKWRLVSQFQMAGSKVYHSVIGRVIDASEVEIDPVTKLPKLIKQ